MAPSNLALPDPDVGALDGGFTAGGAGVFGVLGDFHLFDAGGGSEGGSGEIERG